MSADSIPSEALAELEDTTLQFGKGSVFSKRDVVKITEMLDTGNVQYKVYGFYNRKRLSRANGID